MGHQSETPRGIGGRSLLICVKSKHGCSSGMIGWNNQDYNCPKLQARGPACKVKKAAYLRVCARYFGLTTQQSALINTHGASCPMLPSEILQISLFNRTLCKAESPDTLNPNGISIIRQQGCSHTLVTHVEPGPLRGPYAINQFSLCSTRGSRRLRLLPPGPPFTLGLLVSLMSLPGGPFGGRSPYYQPEISDFLS